MQEAKAQETLRDYLKAGNQLRKEAKLDQAIGQYEQALHLNPDFVPALSQLAGIYESQKQFGKALPYREQAAGLQPKDAPLKAQLASTMMSLGKTQEAITLYQKAIALDRQIYWVYSGLGNALAKNGQLEEAIQQYQQALHLNPDFVPALSQLAGIYESQKQFGKALPYREKAAGLQPENAPLKARLASTMMSLGKTQEAINLYQNEGEIYDKIWKALNQTSLENLEQESANFPTEINLGHVSQYFNLTNQIKIINLASLSEEDKLFIESVGLSLEYLNLNKRLVTKEGISEEKASQRDLDLEQQHLAAKDGYIYAVCPSTGRIVPSNRSLFFAPSFSFYRFVASEVFYLIFGGYQFQKESLYFPRLELIVYLLPQEMLSSPTIKMGGAKKQVQLCKTEVVKNHIKFKSYFLSMGKAKKVVPVGYNFSILHHLFNELAGLHEAQKVGCLHQVDEFLVIGPEFYGGIDEIFEIDSEKIKRFNSESEIKQKIWSEECRNEILENNLFAFELSISQRDQRGRKSCINLIYQQSLKKCSPTVLEEVEEAKKKYFPLLWINVRLRRRVWVEQEEGIANIVKSLYSHFPNLGVVFDGFTRQDRRGSLLVNSYEEEIIKQEKELTNKIQSLLPQEIKIYNNIGCSMYEAIVWAQSIDLCLLTEGSSTAKTGAFNKPKVTHSSKAFDLSHGSRGRKKLDHIVDVNEGDKNPNYHCDWRFLYEELFKIASSLKRA